MLVVLGLKLVIILATMTLMIGNISYKLHSRIFSSLPQLHQAIMKYSCLPILEAYYLQKNSFSCICGMASMVFFDFMMSKFTRNSSFISSLWK